MPAPIIVPQTPITAVFGIVGKQLQLWYVYGNTNCYVSTYNVPNSGVKGVFKLTAPDGTVIYNNTSYSTPDVNGATPLWFKNINLPTNPDGSIVNGIYTAVYSAQITDGVNPPYIVVNTATYNFTYASPKVSITQTVDCISPKYSIADLTNYTVNSVMPVITRTMTLNYPYGSAGAASPLITSA